MPEELPNINDETWVSTVEAEQITGYARRYLQQLARHFYSLPENERLIRVRKRNIGYELWLPDIVKYIDEHGNGPKNRPLLPIDSMS